MSEYFYYQQRWFTQHFLSGQGFGNFGTVKRNDLFVQLRFYGRDEATTMRESAQELVFQCGAQYGIFLNTFGTSVFTYKLPTTLYSTKLNIKLPGMSDDDLATPTRSGNIVTDALITNDILARFFLCVSVFIFEWCLFLCQSFYFLFVLSFLWFFLFFRLCLDI